MNTNIIEPVDYITALIYEKLQQAIEYLKKNKNVKFKNYLVNAKDLIMLGFKNYLLNYSLFLRVKAKF